MVSTAECPHLGQVMVDRNSIISDALTTLKTLADVLSSNELLPPTKT
jgi:hypothetical protein